MESKIKYDPKKSIAEMSTEAGVSKAAVHRYIRECGIDRKFDNQLLIYNRIQQYKRHHPDASRREIAKALEMSVNTVVKYYDKDKRPQKVLNGKVSQVERKNKPLTLLSVSDKESTILNQILHLYCNDTPTFECDLTFGNGSFYRHIPRPKACFDKFPKFDYVLDLDLVNKSLPLYASVVVDLPHYVDAKGEETPEKFASVNDAKHHHKRMLSIARNILKPEGVLIYKTTDFIIEGKQEWMSDFVLMEAWQFGFELVDKFIYVIPNRLTRPSRPHKFATKNYAFFFIFRKRPENDSI